MHEVHMSLEGVNEQTRAHLISPYFSFFIYKMRIVDYLILLLPIPESLNEVIQVGNQSIR